MDMDIMMDCNASYMNEGKKDYGMALHDFSNQNGMVKTAAMDIDNPLHPFAVFKGPENVVEEKCSDYASNDTFFTTLDYEKLANEDQISLKTFRTGLDCIADDASVFDTVPSMLKSTVSDGGFEDFLASSPSLCSVTEETRAEGGSEKVFIKDGENSHFIPKYKFYDWVQKQPTTKYDAARDPYATPPLLQRSLHGTEIFDMEERKRNCPRVVEEPKRFEVDESRVAKTVSFHMDYRVPSDYQYLGCEALKHPRQFLIRGGSESDSADGLTEEPSSGGTVRAKSRTRDVVKRVIGRVFKPLSICFRNKRKTAISKSKSDSDSEPEPELDLHEKMNILRE